ncbi:hypothetical protein BGW80DRAFT_1290998 [Lactifluus volemus]|nr:hypothetical protein BGW80DRAFT_1290998 [Lactifluus volemus]
MGCACLANNRLFPICLTEFTGFVHVIVLSHAVAFPITCLTLSLLLPSPRILFSLILHTRLMHFTPPLPIFLLALALLAFAAPLGRGVARSPLLLDRWCETSGSRPGGTSSMASVVWSTIPTTSAS